jgi:hypothetical protein
MSSILLMPASTVLENGQETNLSFGSIMVISAFGSHIFR